MNDKHTIQDLTRQLAELKTERNTLKSRVAILEGEIEDMTHTGDILDRIPNLKDSAKDMIRTMAKILDTTPEGYMYNMILDEVNIVTKKMHHGMIVDVFKGVDTKRVADLLQNLDNNLENLDNNLDDLDQRLENIAKDRAECRAADNIIRAGVQEDKE